LPLGRPAAVASHGRHDERLQAQPLEKGNDRPDDLRQVGNPPAAHGNRHRLSRSHPAAYPEPFKLAADFAGHVVHPSRVEMLPDSETVWDVAVGQHGWSRGVMD